MSDEKKVDIFDSLPTNSELDYKLRPPKTQHDEKIEIIKLYIGVFLFLLILLPSLYFGFMGSGDTQKYAFPFLTALISGPLGYFLGKK